MSINTHANNSPTLTLQSTQRKKDAISFLLDDIGSDLTGFLIK